MAFKMAHYRRASRALGLALLSISGSASAQQIMIHPGDEGFFLSEAVRQEMAASLLDFSHSPLSGSIAGPGYLPFTGSVQLAGRPLETVPAGTLGDLSVIVRRTTPTTAMVVGDSCVVDAELFSLHLASKIPMVFKPGPTSPHGSLDKPIDLRVRVSTSVPTADGHAFISRTHAEGGLIQYAVTANLALEFLDGSTTVATIDPLGPIDFTTPATPWLHALGPNYLAANMILQTMVPAGVALDRNGDGLPDSITMGTTQLITTASTLSNGSPAAMSTHNWQSDWEAPTGTRMKFIAMTLHGDTDRDAVSDSRDNCVVTFNPKQKDRDVDGIGDVCDPVNGALACFNEVVLSSSTHSSPPFIELWGVSGVSTNGYAIAVVEGDRGTEGVLDAIIDLGGSSFPSDNHFVVGQAGEPYVDLAASGSWSFEPGSQTLVLLEGADLTALTAMVGTQIDADKDGVTDLKGYCTSILDSIAFWDGGPNDRAFDFGSFCALGPANGIFPSTPPVMGMRPHGLFRVSPAFTGYVGPWNRIRHIASVSFSTTDAAPTPGTYNPFW